MSLATELQKLRTLKEEATEKGRLKDAADAAFKQHEAHCLHVMAAEKAGSFRHDEIGVLFTANRDRVKGQIEDRRLFVEHALDTDEAVQEFIDWVTQRRDPEPDEVRVLLYDTLRSLTNLSLKENKANLNAMAKAALDDEKPMPPGVTFRPDPYIQQRGS